MKTKNLFLLFLLFSIGCLSVSCYDYYAAEYPSTILGQENVGDYPPSRFLDGIPWISTKKAYCNSTCLQMIGEWRGIHRPVAYYNWLMGHTYGAFYKDSFKSFMPLADPMKGILFASEYMGLKRMLYSTNDQDLCIRAIKTFIAGGYPVMLMLDYNVFKGDHFFFPHSEILVGYDNDSFYYYEPGFAERFEVGSKGEKASIPTVMKAIENLNKYMGIAVKYHFMIFESAPLQTDPAPVWRRNAGILLGKRIGIVNLAEGAEAFRTLAKDIINDGVPDWGWNALLKFWLEVGRYTRTDNARYIQSNFASDNTLMKAADLFLDSARNFESILLLVGDSFPQDKIQKQKIADLLTAIAETEKETSQILLQLN